MANKYEMITQLADYTAGRILKDPHDYMGFLRCAGQNYKYSFQDQILIYAQKPDATACAEFETWKIPCQRLSTLKNSMHFSPR